MADPYTTLGVARGADENEIKKAYRKLAKELHPDRNKDNPKAAARFSDVTAAYDLLSDAGKRAQFDRGEIDEQGNPRAPYGFGAGGGQPGGFRPGVGPGGFEFNAGGGDFGDIFEGLFGGGRGRGAGAGSGARGAVPPSRGADVAYRLAVSFEDAAALKPQRVTLGSGKTVDLKITADAVDGAPMRLAGQGEAGPGGTGDATVTLEVKPHRFFVRDGADIRLDLPVSLGEAVLGGKIKVPTVDGAVMLTVPKGTGSGKVFRIKGRGFHGRGGRGDQLVTIAIDLPAGDPALERFVADWTPEGERNPRAALGV